MNEIEREQRRFYRVKEACEIMGVPPRTMYDLAETGQIPCRRLGSDPSPGVVGREGADDVDQTLMSVTRRTLPSGKVSWRAKVFWQQRVVAQQSFDRRSDAKRWEADQLSKLRSGGWIDPTRGRMAFGALAEEWQASRQHLAMRSQETTQFLLDSYVVPVVGRLPIAAISAADVERVLTAMTSRGLATATRRRALSVVRLVLDYEVRDRRLAVNVARAARSPAARPSASRTGCEPSSSGAWRCRCPSCAVLWSCSSASPGAGSPRWPRCASTT